MKTREFSFFSCIKLHIRLALLRGAAQRALNNAVLALCPDLYRYYNTPSETLTARDYFPNYDELARIKSRWDPAEVFRIYQGIRPVGFAPDALFFLRVRATAAIRPRV